MLILPSDSGYNSPCDGMAPSSLSSAITSFKTNIELKVRRKLQFASPSKSAESYMTSPKMNGRSRKIAQRLLEMCDLFDKEFAKVSEDVKDLTWITSILRIIGF